jgi:Putative rRNA methylase
MDIQELACENTRKAILDSTTQQLMGRVTIINRNHKTFPDFITPNSVALVVYNLGYLPGGDKGVTTVISDTLESITSALLLIRPKGLLSVLCYRCD